MTFLWRRIHNTRFFVIESATPPIILGLHKRKKKTGVQDLTAIQTVNLEKSYVTWKRKGFLKREKQIVKALNGVSFKVNWGEVFGLLGPNGAGKTTTVKIITTLLLPDKGDAIVAGNSVTKNPVKVREKIGVVLSVEKGFFWKLTGKENLRYFGMLRGMKKEELEEQIEKVLDIVGLKQLGGEDKLYEEYSLGMKARLSLARAMLHEPPILILDEPTLGLDPPAARTIRELLVKLAHKEKKTIMITTHNMYEAEMICDRIAIISEGKIAGIGTPTELKKKVAEMIPIEITLAGKTVNEHEELTNIIQKKTGLKTLLKTDKENYIFHVLTTPEKEEETVAELLSIISSAGYRIKRIQVMEPSLEDVFIKLTSNNRERR